MIRKKCHINKGQRQFSYIDNCILINLGYTNQFVATSYWFLFEVLWDIILVRNLLRSNKNRKKVEQHQQGKIGEKDLEKLLKTNKSETSTKVCPQVVWICFTTPTRQSTTTLFYL